jgi:hypothetical protein
MNKSLLSITTIVIAASLLTVGLTTGESFALKIRNGKSVSQTSDISTKGDNLPISNLGNLKGFAINTNKDNNIG